MKTMEKIVYYFKGKLTFKFSCKGKYKYISNIFFVYFYLFINLVK